MAEPLDEVTCCKCKETFGIARSTRQILLRTHQNFWCPHGHVQHYPEGESQETKLRRERDLLKQSIAYEQDRVRRAVEEAEHQRRRAIGYKGHAARITKRAKAGVCPCCNRSFENLRRHMASQHPQFTPEAPDTPLSTPDAGGR